ncbi:FAS1 domain-containing protein SELMODRAFT_448915-like [Vigna radiata var. radiata]|uniref:FAS1 domain-containing protein SELMODRAFT_448915-like n=1 Tax=Vigna radiata var. radiata TaxID=3916 RepID=A0A1S3VB86_VIGRR|nr:FAS1 domain-containing protein SELMODRAFT_448915-like [Vigna radiata var. radiata]
MVDPTSSTPSPPTQQDGIIGTTYFGAVISLLSSNNGTLPPFSATIFLPRDASLDRPVSDPLLLPYHVVPQRLPFSDLLLLRRGARLPTLLTGKTISVTDNSPAKFSINHMPLIHPDLLSTPYLAVHGVQSLFNYSSGCRLNGVVSVPSFSLVLPRLLSSYCAKVFQSIQEIIE